MNENWYKTASFHLAAIPNIDLSKIPEEAQGGDCYEVSGRYVLDNGFKNPNLQLAHGNVIGQGRISGVQYDHAWIEDGDTVIDKSLGRNIQLPKAVYYALGRITDVKLYNVQETRKMILQHHHWGPWE